MPQIVTLTLNPAVDKSSTVDRVVAEHKLRCSEPTYDPGGGGINVARAIHKLGGEATAYWMCGGAIGDLLAGLLDEEDLSHEAIPIRAMTRENMIVYEESSTQQYRFGMPGARLREEELKSCIARLREIEPPPQFLVLSGSLPPGADPDLYARIAKEMPNTCRVVLDSSGEPLKRGIEGSVYLIKPNVRELGQLAGREIEDDAQIRSVSLELIREHGIEAVVTSLGSGGAVLVTADDCQHIRAPTVKIRSKVGAGDSTVGGLVLGLAQGKSLLDATRFGIAAGSAAVMTEGTELCRKEDTERLFNEFPENTTTCEV